VTHMATYLKFGYTHEDTVSRVKAVAECVMTYFFLVVWEKGMKCIIPLRRHSANRSAPMLQSYWKLEVLRKSVTLALRLRLSLEQPRVLMSCAWTILFVMLCFIVLVWIRNCFLDRNNSGPKRLWHMVGRNIKIDNYLPSI
jgi:hypothetical protein